jgi:hypothetical protein
LSGRQIRNNAGDFPTAETGQVFFDSTNLDFKYQFPNLSVGSWRTGNALNTGRTELQGAGIQTSAIVFGGEAPPGQQAIAESYNGVSFTEVADLNTARKGLGGAGASNTSALAFGGDPGPGDASQTAATELWNGSSWTETADLNTSRHFLMDAGNATNALAFGGGDGSGVKSETESWNGSAWTETADLNSGREYGMGSGIYTSALAYGGVASPRALTESWNGSAWTEVSDLNTGRYNGQGAGESNTAAIVGGGYTGTAPTVNAELWNGSSWAEQNNLNVGRNGFGSAGTSTLAVQAGGQPNAPTGHVEEWSAKQPVGAWSTYKCYECSKSCYRRICKFNSNSCVSFWRRNTSRNCCNWSK